MVNKKILDQLVTSHDLKQFREKQQHDINLITNLYLKALILEKLSSVFSFCKNENKQLFQWPQTEVTKDKFSCDQFASFQGFLIIIYITVDSLGFILYMSVVEFLLYLYMGINAVSSWSFNVFGKICGYEPPEPTYVEIIIIMGTPTTTTANNNNVPTPLPSFEKQLEILPDRLDELKVVSQESVESYGFRLSSVEAEMMDLYNEHTNKMYNSAMVAYRRKPTTYQ